jgi:sugar lactone lactonase YvrE
MDTESKVLLGGLVFPECPRWHDGKLWFSDMHALRVMTVGLDGESGPIVDVPGQPGGLGWLPDGRLLVVSQTDRRLWRLDPQGLVEVADLSGMVPVSCNDMVVDGEGRAYIGHFGSQTNTKQSSWSPAEIISVERGGRIRIAADNLRFPNGMAIAPDGRTLIVAESFAGQLSAFKIEADGSLTGRRVWAPLPGVMPDGICLDAEGMAWVATCANEVIRIREGGEIVARVGTSARAFACMLGGPDRRTLFVLAAESFVAQEVKLKKSGRIETVRLGVPGAGRP